MAIKSMIMEFGMGTDIRGGDYAKVAARALEDAVHHSSLTMFRILGIDPDSMQIELRLAAHQPEEIDLEAVSKALPFGHVTPKAIKGGLNIVDEASGQPCVIVNAGIVVRLPLTSDQLER